MADGIISSIPSNVMADAQLVARFAAEGKPVPSDVAARVHAEARRIRDEILRKHGVVDIGVPAIRELRAEFTGP